MPTARNHNASAPSGASAVYGGRFAPSVPITSLTIGSDTTSRFGDGWLGGSQEGADKGVATVRADGTALVFVGDGHALSSINASLGVLAVDVPSIASHGLWDGQGPETVQKFACARDYSTANSIPPGPPAQGKTSGVIDISGTTYMLLQEQDVWQRMRVGKSTDQGVSWSFNSASWAAGLDNTHWDFAEADALFHGATICQMTPGYQSLPSAVAGYIYVLDVDNHTGSVGDRIALARVPVTADAIMDRAQYEWWTGSGWTSVTANRGAILIDADGVAVSPHMTYIPALNRYILIFGRTITTNTFKVYEAPAPWGPWTVVPVSVAGGGATNTPSISNAANWIFDLEVLPAGMWQAASADGNGDVACVFKYSGTNGDDAVVTVSATIGTA